MSLAKRHLAAVALCALLLVSVAPIASAAPPEETIPPPLRCLDVDGGVGTLSVQGATILGSINGDTVDFSIDLVEPSCPDGIYRFEVFDNDADHTPLAVIEVGGNQTTNVAVSLSVRPDPDGCVRVQVTTIDSKRGVVDLAPNDGRGGDVGRECGGGGSVWK